MATKRLIAYDPITFESFTRHATKHREPDACQYDMGYVDACDQIDDWMYANAVDAVEIPCKIGDRVWAIRNYGGHKHPQDGIVHEMYFTEGMRLIIHVKHIARGEWGKEIFAAREEAVAAITGGRTDG